MAAFLCLNQNRIVTMNAIMAIELHYQLGLNLVRCSEIIKFLQRSPKFPESFGFGTGDSLFQFMLNGGYGSQTATLPADVYGKRWSLLTDFYSRSKNMKLKTG